MAKKLEHTQELINSIRKTTGDDSIDVSTFAIFQARMLSTEAIKQGGFFDGSVVSRSTLVEMSDYVNKEGTVVPLQTMHNKQMLPVGRLFNTQVNDLQNGHSELVGYFYIPQDDEMKISLVKDIESALIEEVSVGLLCKHALCSECGYDYFGEEAELINILLMTCENNHTIGKNGVHVRLVGMETFAELSLVGRGAAKDAKILSRARKNGAFDKGTVERLAASGIPMETHLLNATTKFDKSNPEGGYNMTLETILAETSQKLGKIEVELSQAKDTITNLNAKISTLEESEKEKNKKILSLEASQGEDVKELTASNEKLTAELTEAKNFIFEDVKAALVASGEKEDDVPEDLVAMLSLVREKGLKLHQLFGAGPKADATKTDVTADKSANRRVSNFKING